MEAVGDLIGDINDLLPFPPDAHLQQHKQLIFDELNQNVMLSILLVYYLLIKAYDMGHLERVKHFKQVHLTRGNENCIQNGVISCRIYNKREPSVTYIH